MRVAIINLLFVKHQIYAYFMIGWSLWHNVVAGSEGLKHGHLFTELMCCYCDNGLWECNYDQETCCTIFKPVPNSGEQAEFASMAIRLEHVCHSSGVFIPHCGADFADGSSERWWGMMSLICKEFLYKFVLVSIDSVLSCNGKCAFRFFVKGRETMLFLTQMGFRDSE